MWRTQKAWQEKCDGLETRVGELESDAEARESEVASLQSQLAEAQEALASNPTQEQIAQLTRERDEALAAAAPARITEAAIAMVNGTSEDADSQAKVQTIIANRVTEALSKAGHPAPVDDDGGKDVSNSNLKGREKVIAHFKSQKK